MTDDVGRRGVAGRLRALLTTLMAVRLGLAGQILTFGAMIVPIVLQENEQLIVLVLVSALVGLLVNATTLAYGFVLPVIRSRHLAALATVLSAVTLTACSLALLPLTLLEDRWGLASGTFLGAAGLLWAQGVYTMLVAALVRTNDPQGLGLARVVYGAVLLVSVVLACTIQSGPLGLVVATAASYALTTLVLELRRPTLPRLRDLAARTGRRRLARAYVRHVVAPTASGVVSGWVLLLSALTLPGLGVYAAPWAVVNRICGGFGTLLQTVLSPPVEARLSQAFRDDDAPELVRARRTGLRQGTGMAAIAVVVSLLLALYSTGGRDADRWLLPIAVATLLFWGPQLAVTPLNRVLNFARHHGTRLVWETARAGSLTAAFLVTEGVTRLVVMGVVIAVASGAMVPLTRPARLTRAARLYAAQGGAPEAGVLTGPAATTVAGTGRGRFGWAPPGERSRPGDLRS